jgi:hypothetical protein
MSYLRNLKYGIKNLIRWFPIIWKDRNWDFYYIYLILRHKLHLTEQHIRRHSFHTRAEKDADQIKKCVLILDRIIKDDYFEMAMRAKGKLKFEINDGRLETIAENVDPNDKKQTEEVFKRVVNHETYLEQQDKKMLFKLIERNIDGWWD